VVTKERWPPERKRKNTKRWCKGKVGREHKPVKQWSHLAHYRLARGGPVCTTSSWLSSGWSCYHELACSTCGKILVQFLSKEECPDARP
jgi:hypothetical protein